MRTFKINLLMPENIAIISREPVVLIDAETTEYWHNEDKYRQIDRSLNSIIMV